MAKLREAKKQMEQRAEERLKKELAEHEAKLKERAEKQQRTGHKPAGREPQPPQDGPKDKDQYNFTDPESRIMKHRGGFEQAYNAQATLQPWDAGENGVIGPPGASSRASGILMAIFGARFCRRCSGKASGWSPRPS